MAKILYSAVVLDKQSHGKLLNTFSNVIPDDWKTFAHHMTIVFGEGLPQDLENYKGMKVRLVATEFGMSDKVMAVKVEGFQSNNEIPHITIAVDVNSGGKPFHSNNIKDWKSLNQVVGVSRITLEGVVDEVMSN